MTGPASKMRALTRNEESLGTAFAERSWPLWLALGAAFSPVLVDTGQHLVANPWARYALWFPLLFVRCARVDRRGARPLAGMVLIVSGLAIELAAAFAGVIRWGRPGAAIGAIGLTLWQGSGSWRSRVLLFFAVPLPAFLVKAARDWADPLVAWTVDAFCGSEACAMLGADLVRDGQILLTVDRSWLSSSALLAGLAWYHAILTGRRSTSALTASAFAAVLAWPLHALVLGLGIVLADLGAHAMAQTWADHGLPIAAAACVVAFAEWRHREVARRVASP